MGVRQPRVELWSDYASAGGTLLAHDVELLDGSEVEFSLKGDDRLRIRTPSSAAWLPRLDDLHVLRLVDDVLAADAGEDWTLTGHEDFRVRTIERVDGPGDAVSKIEALALITDLAECGPIYTVGADGVQNFNFGELLLTHETAWNSYIDPFLEMLGITWWNGEPSPPGDIVPVTVTNMTPLALLRAVAAGAGTPYEVWSVGSQVRARHRAYTNGVATATRKLDVRRDDNRVIRISERRTSERLASTAVAARNPVSGSSGVGLYGLVFEVTDVSGSVIELADPEGSGLIAFDDQLGGASALNANHYFRKANGTLTEITDTDGANSKVTVASATNISVGDLIEIRRDSDDMAPVDAGNPALMGFRKTVALFGQRHEGRNYCRNPFFRWPNANYVTVYACRLNGTYTAGTTSVALKDLPPSITITDRSRLTILNVSANTWFTTVNGDTAVSGSGTVTLTLDSAIRNSGNVAGDNHVLLFMEPDVDLADDWSSFQGTTLTPSGAFTPIWQRRRAPTLQPTDPSATVANTVALVVNGTGAVHEIDLADVSPLADIEPGDLLVHDSSGNAAVVVAFTNILIDGTGTATVVPLATQTWTASDAVTVIRPALGAGNRAGQALICWRERSGVSGSTGNHGWISDVLGVPFINGWILRARAKWRVYNNHTSDITITPGTGVQAFTVAIHNDAAGLGTQRALAEDAERTYPSREVTEVEVSVDFTPSSEEDLRVRIEPIHWAGTSPTGEFDVKLTQALQEVSLSYGPAAYDLEGVEFSGTNLVYASMIEALQSFKSPRQIQVDVRDTAYEDGSDMAREKIVLGSPWYVNSDVLGIAATPAIPEAAVRVVRYLHDLFTPTKARVTLDHDPNFLTRAS